MGKVLNVIKSSVLPVLVILLLSGCVQNNFPCVKEKYESGAYKPTLNKPCNSKVKNIIFCIGDGMGTAHVMLACVKSRGIDGKLNMEQMPVTGLMRTHSADAVVTDSAAAGTALASGIKTNNGMIGIAPDGTKFETILEAAKKKGLATGLVATSTISHATPASFGSHVTSRYMEDKIAEQLIENEVTVLFGGGRKFFLPKTDKKSKRSDNRNLIEEAKRAGYLYIETAEQLKAVKGGKVLGLFQDGPLSTEPPEPSLAKLSKKAIEILSLEDKGFFLMIEGSQIDWAAHDHDGDGVVKQTLEFDKAVKEAVDFALKDKQTLVVVTSDHETGGLTIIGGDFEGKLDLGWSTGGHSAVVVPVYAFGPKAEKFSGVQDNTEIPKKFAELLGIKPFPKKLD